jgi:hypothetical protein
MRLPQTRALPLSFASPCLYSQGMKPVEICTLILKNEKMAAIIGELSNPQVKAVMKKGDLKIKLPAGYLSQQKRRQLWTTKIEAAIAEGNQQLAAELLQQWLLNHRRSILAAFLDRLEIKHRQGETDESFLITRSAEKIREAATWLLEQHDRSEALAYLAYIAYQQRSMVFDGWPALSPPTEPPSPPAQTDPAPASTSAR